MIIIIQNRWLIDVLSTEFIIWPRNLKFEPYPIGTTPFKLMYLFDVHKLMDVLGSVLKICGVQS